MKTYIENKTRLAEYVKGTVLFSELDSPLTMTITPESYGAYSVLTVTDESSDDIGIQTAKFFSDTQVNT